MVSRVAASAATFLFLIIVPAAAQQPTGLTVEQHTVEGNERVATDAFLAETGIRIGDKITINDVQVALRKLWGSGNYKDIEPRLIELPGENTVRLHWNVSEQPFVSRVEFRGLENIRGSAVLDTVGLRANSPYRPARAAAAEGVVREMLARKGLQLRSIKHELVPVPRSKTEEFNLVFTVEEGQRVAIADVDFEGNQIFDDDDLKGQLATRSEGFLWFKPGLYDEDKLREDLRKNLPAYYGSRGYLDFAVLGDSLAVDPETGKARLIITVSEGPQYRLAAFDVNGNRRFSSEEIKRYFEQESAGGLLKGFGLGGARTTQVTGQPFDATAFESATARVKQLYSNSGYLYAQVNPTIEKTDSNTVRVAWDIREGEPAYINTVTIAGNTYTHEEVIRNQLLVIPGDVYNEELLIQSFQRISSLGFFETPLSPPGIQPNEKGDVDITFEVKERQTGSVNFGTAVGGGTGLAGFLGYDQPNLFGQAKSGHLRWEFGRYSNNFEASYSDPAIQGSRYSGSISLFSARDRFIQFNEGRRRRTGAGLRFGIPMPNDARSRLTVGYTIARTTYEKFDDESQSIFNLPPGVQSTVTLGLQRFNLDHPMFPTSGTRQEIEASINGGILGGNGDFQKYIVSGAWYVPVGRIGGSAPGSRPIRMTLGLSAEGGALFGDASRFPFERFWMGGVQFGRPLRGYEETTVTPLGYSPRCQNTVSGACLELGQRLGDSFLRLTAEYAVRFNDNLSISAFYDAGGVWYKPGEINPTRLLRGAGIGAMLVTPFGPLGLDYAYGFDKTRPGWQLHFKFGQGF